MSKTISYTSRALAPYSIGLKLRSLRTRKHLTLSRLAAETGLSTALLSKLETDRMIPTLPTLSTIARVYGVGMSYFFSEPSRHSLSITRRVHLEEEGRGQNAIKITPLNAVTHDSRLKSEMVEFIPGGAMLPVDHITGSACVIYVMEGRLRLEFAGMEETLETGDCACMESDMTLAWSPVGKDRCRILLVTPGADQKRG